VSVIDTRTARVIAVTSGKGGAGKTNISVNLGVALARLGRRTMLVDCDVGLANANILLGVESDLTIADVTTRDRPMAEVTRQGPGGMMLLPGHSGAGLGGGLADDARAELAAAFRPHVDDYDHVLVDTGGGMAGEGLSLVASSDLILVVLASEPTAFMDAYALVKGLALRHGCTDFAIVANRVSGEAAGRALFDRFNNVVGRFLPVGLDYLGAIPEDPYLRDAVFAKRCCVEAFPSSPASKAFGRIAQRIAEIDMPMLPGGHRFFGLEVAHGAH
jgi:flagellar biosynthesis protein FlhG